VEIKSSCYGFNQVNRLSLPLVNQWVYLKSRKEILSEGPLIIRDYFIDTCDVDGSFRFKRL